MAGPETGKAFVRHFGGWKASAKSAAPVAKAAGLAVLAGTIAAVTKGPGAIKDGIGAAREGFGAVKDGAGALFNVGEYAWDGLGKLGAGGRAGTRAGGYTDKGRAGRSGSENTPPGGNADAVGGGNDWESETGFDTQDLPESQGGRRETIVSPRASAEMGLHSAAMKSQCRCPAKTEPCFTICKQHSS